MITIHLVLQSHIDPVWLWPWPSGLDMALGTCRTACDLLDRHPDLVFTRGEGWIYHAIEQTEPALFERIRAHVVAGRWEIAGGWWLQPDCNFPGAEGLRKQIELGRAYFLDKFGQFPRYAYNVDSFGHAATLPDLLRAAGQNAYVMMRPQEHEKDLPGRLFRWRSREGGAEVTTFRIAKQYSVRPPLGDQLDHLQASLRDLPPGIAHTMCFIGAGDHGGGVTEQTIAWLRAHAHVIEGARLVFSSPSRFFAAVESRTPDLPLATGELQSHAVGCYSVYRPIKVAVRAAEHRLHQADLMRRLDPRPAADFARGLTHAWRQVCFAHFHDTLGGTCIPSAYPQVENQLGEAIAWADEGIHFGLRRRLAQLPDDRSQRLVAANLSDRPFRGWIEFEPWFEISVSVPEFALVDEEGREMPYQRIEPEALCIIGMRLLFRAELASADVRTLRLEYRPPAPVTPGVRVEGTQIVSEKGARVRLDGARSMTLGGLGDVPLPEIHLLADASDTWSHGVAHYPEKPLEMAAWQTAEVIEEGPLRAVLHQQGSIGKSALRAEWRVYDGDPFVEMLLEVDWREQHKLLKLVWPLTRPVTERFDGILGGELSRPFDGQEVCLRDRTLVRLEGGATLGVVCPDVFALDATPQRLRFTLLRAALMAQHDPFRRIVPRARIADQGRHLFRFRFLAGASLQGAALDDHALAFHRPPVLADLTRGMPPLVDKGWRNPERK